jgi:hypothetical protein
LTCLQSQPRGKESPAIAGHPSRGTRDVHKNIRIFIDEQTVQHPCRVDPRSVWRGATTGGQREGIASYDFMVVPLFALPPRPTGRLPELSAFSPARGRASPYTINTATMQICRTVTLSRQSPGQEVFSATCQGRNRKEQAAADSWRTHDVKELPSLRRAGGNGGRRRAGERGRK